MALIPTKSLQDFINFQLLKRKNLEPNININPDTMVYMDAAVLAELAYLLQQDAVSLVNNAFLAYASWDELSNLWADRGVNRLAATKSLWTLTFWRAAISTDNYFIVTGTLVSTQPAGAEWKVITFQTTEDAMLYAQVPTPWAPSYTTQTSWGLIPDWVYSYKITAISGDNKETDAGLNTDVTISNWLSSNVISLTWSAVPNAVWYNVYLFVGGFYVLLHQTTAPSYVDTDGTSINTQEPPTTNQTGNLEVDVPAECTTWGNLWNVAPNTITQFITKPTWIEYVVNNAEFSGGSDREDDETYRERIAATLRLNTGKVTVSGYKQTCEAVPWVWTATVTIPVWGMYRNEIEIIITSGGWSWIPTQALIDAVQRIVNLDENRAVCDDITVRGPDTQAIDYTIEVIDYDHWYSQAYLITSIQDAIEAYFRSVPVGQIIYVVWIANAVHDTLGIVDFAVTLPVANIPLWNTAMAVTWVTTINFI